MADFTPSLYQQTALTWVREGRGSAVVVAVAGAGKTKLIELALGEIPPYAHVQLVAFNKPIAEELTRRVAKIAEETGVARPHVRAGTFHSVGFGAVRKHLRVDVQKPDDQKCRRLFEAKAKVGRKPEEAEALVETYCSFVCDLVALAKGAGIGAIAPDTDDAWYGLIQHHDLTLDEEGADEARAVDLARKLLAMSNAAAKAGSIDYNDMLYLPLLWKCRLWQNDWVIADEAQDTNPVRRALLRLMLKPQGRLMAVGDQHQCQPTGTLVYVSNRGGTPIEDLTAGDQLLTYCNSYFPGKITQGRILEQVASRSYTGDLIKISAGGYSHEVTPSHRCVVRMAERLGSMVYVMKKGNLARVGRCDNIYYGSFGLAMRCRQERADEAWVLGFFDTTREDEARILETTAAYEYSMPQLCFNYSERGSEPRKDIRQRFWNQFSSNINRMNDCLRDFGLDPHHPFWAKGSGKHISGKYSFELTASNLFDGWMDVCVFDGNPHKPQWVTSHIERRKYSGRVYSLKVQPNERGQRLYIANGIVTHNSIYGFTGASSDAIEIIKREFGANELKLTESFRCPRAVGDLARTLVPYFETAAGAPEGRVSWLKLKDALPMLGAHDAILCRSTAPLIALAYRLIAQGVGCKVLGREIGKGLTNLVGKLKARTLPTLEAKLQTYADREIAKHTARGEEQKAAAVQDRIDCLRTVIDALPETERTIAALCAKVESIFSDTNGVLLLSTIHKAKGREWPTVAILEPERMPSRWARQEHQIQEEQNIQYVAYTRAQQHLIFIETEKPQ